jgi:hypothetical protein
MKIFSHTGSPSKEGVVLETPVQKLLVAYTAAAAANFEALLTELKAIKFEANIVNAQTGTSPLVYPMRLLDLMEIAAWNEGFVKVAGLKVVGTIELSNVAALDLGTDQISLSFTGMENDGILEVNTIDTPFLTKSFISYAPINFQKDAPKEINVEDFYQVALPKSLITKLELKYPNGRNVGFTVPELETILDEVNEMCYLEDFGATGKFSVIPGAKDWFCFGVEDAISAKITLSDTGICYFVKNQDLI